jgi:hypothetical protein
MSVACVSDFLFGILSVADLRRPLISTSGRGVQLVSN